MPRMEKVAGDTASLTPRETSPRSTLGWKDDSSGCESPAGLEAASNSKPRYERSKSFVGVLHERVKSLVGVSHGRSKTLVGGSHGSSKSLVGLSSAVNLVGPKLGPKAPSNLPLKRQLLGDVSLPLNADHRVIPESPSSSTEGNAARASEKPPISGSAFQIAVGEHVWEPVWGQDRRSEVSPIYRRSSAGFTSARDDSNSVGTAGDDTRSVDSSVSSAAIVGRETKGTSSDRMQFVNSLNDELTSIKACVRHAIDLGKNVSEHHGALDVSQLRGEKMDMEASVQKSVLLNRDLDQQVCTLRDEVQKLQWEREMEVMAMNDEIQELEMERNTLMKAARDEKNKREKLQNEVDSILSVLLEEKMKLGSEREAHEAALLSERKKLNSMRKARDAAMKALEEGNKKLEAEREAMLMAMRDLTYRLDFERDAKLKSMRRSSLDMANMMSSFRVSGRNNSISANDPATPSPRGQLSRRSSKQFQ